jgi:predicted negative regulator of RcsB-dependent stress response
LITSLLGFAGSPLGKVVVVVLALTAWTGYQRHQAATKAREACQAEQLRKTIAEIERQRDAARSALEAAEARADSSDQELGKLKEEMNAIRVEGTECVVPDSAIEQLRNIR